MHIPLVTRLSNNTSGLPICFTSNGSGYRTFTLIEPPLVADALAAAAAADEEEGGEGVVLATLHSEM